MIVSAPWHPSRFSNRRGLFRSGWDGTINNCNSLKMLGRLHLLGPSRSKQTILVRGGIALSSSLRETGEKTRSYFSSGGSPFGPLVPDRDRNSGRVGSSLSSFDSGAAAGRLSLEWSYDRWLRGEVPFRTRRIHFCVDNSSIYGWLVSKLKIILRAPKVFDIKLATCREQAI